MTSIGDGFKNIFLAGIGAMAYTGEKGKELIDQLVEKGEITLEQGRELNEELQRKATQTTQGLRESALEVRMRAMSPAEREAFAATVARIASEQSSQPESVVAEVIAEDDQADTSAKEAPADASNPVKGEAEQE